MSRPPHRPSTPTERGDTDLEGSASSLARTNLPREPRHGQQREPARPNDAEPVGLRGAEDGATADTHRDAERNAEGDATEGGTGLGLKRPKRGEDRAAYPEPDESPRPSRFHMPG